MGENASYTGVDNLEVMADAKNYNAYLTRLILKNITQKDHVVDFGAGSGTFAGRVSDQGMNVSCIEPDQLLGEVLSSKGLTAHKDIDELADESVDFVYSLNVLEHIDDDAAIVKALYKKLKPGGRVLIYVPAFMVLFTSMDEKVGHVRRYTKGDLISLMKESGFRVDKAGYADSLGFFATLAFKWIGNDSGDINRTALKIYDSFCFPISRLMDLFLSPFLGKNVLIEARKL